MTRKKLILAKSSVIVALTCCATSLIYPNQLLKRQASRLADDLAVTKQPPVALAFDFPVATDGYDADRGMKADEIVIRPGKTSNIGVPWNVERAMIPTRNAPNR